MKGWELGGILHGWDFGDDVAVRVHVFWKLIRGCLGHKYVKLGDMYYVSKAGIFIH